VSVPVLSAELALKMLALMVLGSPIPANSDVPFPAAAASGRRHVSTRRCHVSCRGCHVRVKVCASAQPAGQEGGVRCRREVVGTATC